MTNIVCYKCKAHSDQGAMIENETGTHLYCMECANKMRLGSKSFKVVNFGPRI